MNFSYRTAVTTLAILISVSTLTKTQKLCNFVTSPNFKPTNGTVFIQNFSAGKCLRVQAFGVLPNSKAVLDECSYWKTATKDQQFMTVNSAFNKTTFKMDAGRDEKFCLTSSGGSLKTVACDPKSFDQSWTVKSVQGHAGQFLVEQYSSKKCLRPRSRSTGAEIQLTPCNSLQTEQIWKICI